jgi:bifunctional UDP-N-acetylglucosamine pyrophosphorylase/glucosamine-1-phosphate N-acetyltransferase
MAALIPSSQIAILAAGKSTRMKSAIPKILHTLQGQPLIRYVADAARAANGGRPILVISPEHRQALERLFGDEVDFVVQTEQRGTGHAVMSIPRAQVAGSQHLVVLYGDQPLLTAATIRRLMQAHAAAHVPLTMMTVSVPSFAGDYAEFNAFGRVLRQAGGTLDRIVEYKDASEEVRRVREVNPGYYCFDIEWLYGHLPQVTDQNSQNEYYLTDLIGMARKENTTVAVVPIDDPWEGFGVNTPEALVMAERLLASRGGASPALTP